MPAINVISGIVNTVNVSYKSGLIVVRMSNVCSAYLGEIAVPPGFCIRTINVVIVYCNGGSSVRFGRLNRKLGELPATINMDVSGVTVIDKVVMTTMMMNAYCGLLDAFAIKYKLSIDIDRLRDHMKRSESTFKPEPMPPMTDDLIARLNRALR